MASVRVRAPRLVRRTVQVGLLGLAAAHVIEAMELRKRRAHVTALGDAEPGTTGELYTVTAGTRVDTATRAAAHQEMLDTGAQVVDLVPGNLPVDRALRLLRRVDPRKQKTDPLYTPGGAHEAAVLEPDLAERMRQDGDLTLDRFDMVRETVQAQRHAATRSVLRVAPKLSASPWTAEDRWREMEAVTSWARPYSELAPVLAGAETAHLIAMTAGFLISPVTAALALATWSAQPALVFGPNAGGAGDADVLTPPDAAGAALLRLPRAMADNLRTIAAGIKATRAREAERAKTPVPPPPSPSELFEPRRDDCAWCGGPNLSLLLTSNDLLQHKDGTFRLDECQDCGHIFQNPILTAAGLNWYYKDAYDGLGEESAEAGFAAVGDVFYSRLETISKLTEPKAWLEVGTSRGAFCAVARQRFPEAEFHGLDMGETVEEAQRRGRIDHGYRGMFQQIVDDIPRKYDVVSMDQYLEHTLDPRGEVAAASKIVEQGGFLMIEVPDPESPWARRLGRYWWQWAQPQHVHFVSCQGMIDAMQENGFEVVSVERGPSTLGGELFNAVGLKVVDMARSPHVPWLPKPGLAHRVKRGALFALAAPVLAAAKVADSVKDRAVRQPNSTTPGNAYRIVGRRK